MSKRKLIKKLGDFFKLSTLSKKDYHSVMNRITARLQLETLEIKQKFIPGIVYHFNKDKIFLYVGKGIVRWGIVMVKEKNPLKYNTNDVIIFLDNRLTKLEKPLFYCHDLQKLIDNGDLVKYYLKIDRFNS